MSVTFEPVIGLEVHAELETQSKMFCGCAVVDSTMAPANSVVCPVCLGMPGVLPVINKRAVEFAIRVGLALHCEIAPTNQFARKSYFYPDLPKGYQVSQYELPIAVNGWLEIDLPDGSTKRISIRRAHLEEDTGKLTHVGDASLVDFNRSGVPLLEIVSEPDIASAVEAEAYARKLRSILQYLGVNSGDMSKGVLRFEANVSVRPVGSKGLRTRTEIKNLNSIRTMQRASDFEIERQIKIYNQGGTVTQATLGWDELRQSTVVQREKESAHDYRYFPEPDLPSLAVSREWVAEIRRTLPELPDAKRDRFISLGLSRYDASVLAAEHAVGDYFEATLAAGADAKKAANWIINNVFFLMNKAALSAESIGSIKITPAALVALIKLVDAGTLNNNAAKKILDSMYQEGGDPTEWAAKLGLVQTRDTAEIEAVVEKILSANTSEVARFCAGEEKVLKFLTGQIMREGRGKFPADLVQQVLTEKAKGRC